MQFQDISEKPYALAHVQHQPVEEPEVNPSASLNEWLVFPDSQEIEVHFYVTHLLHLFIYFSFYVIFSSALCILTCYT
jgi:hypothetical protein